MIWFQVFHLLTILLLVDITTASATVTGIVRGVQENPISGALVTFTSEANPADTFSGYTNAGGRYDIAITTLGVGDISPAPFTLHQNHPNPFNPSTTITFSTAESGIVTLSVYNLLGQRVRTLVSGTMPAGDHAMVWDGRDDDGSSVGAGVYLYRLAGGGRAEVKKMLLLDGAAAGGGAMFALIPAALKFAAATWTVTITGEEIESREMNGQEITDGGAYDFYVIFTGELMNFHLVPIPGGTFEMGEVWERPEWYTFGLPHTVILSDFEMSTYEITNTQYTLYLNEALAIGEVEMINGDPYGKGGEWDGKRYIDLEVNLSTLVPEKDCHIMYQNGSFKVEQPEWRNWPVAAVTWYGAKAFAVHYGLDLPREAEWEYAAGGGSLEYRYATDDGTFDLTKVNYDDNGHPVEVGSYPPNPFGLYDMSGNIDEWCNDWYLSYPTLFDITHDPNDYGKPLIDPLVNPVGPETGNYRSIRGGSYNGSSSTCGTIYRNCYKPEGTSSSSEAVKYTLGFRVVRR